MRDLTGVPDDRLAEALSTSIAEEVADHFTTLGPPGAPIFALGVDVREVVSFIILGMLEQANALAPKCGCGELSAHPSGNCAHGEQELADHFGPGR